MLSSNMDRIKLKIESIYAKDIVTSDIDNEKLAAFGVTSLTLRPYQEEGVAWMVERYHRQHGCILGDEMGLGKTCQTISFLMYLHGSGASKGPFLILSPLSVIGNWQNELARFAPKLKLTSYLGDKETRAELRGNIKQDRSTLCVLLSTYEICLKDEEFLRKFSWEILVVDEGHRLKNRESLLHQVLLDFDIEHRILLTGTPVQNNLRELYSLLCFVAPKIFREKYMEEFVETYSDADLSSGLSELHSLLKPFLLRRVKSDVVKDLPKKLEVVLYHGLSALQKKYYKAILTKDTELFENPYSTSKTRLMNILMQLRKCVNHPYLFDGVEPEPFLLGEHLVEASGKLLLIDQLLSYLKARGHKVLMFSQMTRMLDILQDYLGYRGYMYERLDGSVRGEERYLAIQNFNADDDTFIFLLSTKAGGQGLNLASADTVIFVDSDFNPQNDLQAAARAHRIGQTRPVKVIRLVGRSTVDEIVLKKAEAKLKLTSSVIEGGQFSLGSSKESFIADNNMQLQDILKFGVEQLFETDESSIEDVDFDSMLGATVGNQWQHDINTQTQGEETEVEDEKEAVGESMYVFEGTDYSKEASAADTKTLNNLLNAQKIVLEESLVEGRALRKNRSVLLTGIIPDIQPTKPRKQLTPEELEERKKKKAETAARRAKEAEELEVRKAQELRKRREDVWEANSYTSYNISLDSEGESEDDEELDTEEGDNTSRTDISYIVGDVTHPQCTGSQDAVVVHCVDDSGRWGQGGLFSAISARTSVPDDHYTMAGRMKDLALGDAHLIPIDDLQSREQGHDYLALIIAQHRDRKNILSGIKLSALSQGLQRIYRAAKKMKAGVHLPRIGHNTPGFNWYGTERLIRKHLTSRGIPTHIYYYPRKQLLKRKSTVNDRVAVKNRRLTTEKDSQTEAGQTGSESSQEASKDLPNFLEGVCVHFHDVSDDILKKLRRFLIAYDGDFHKTVEDSTTHVVTVPEARDKQKLKEYATEFEEVIVVTTQWLEDCIAKHRKLNVSRYLVNLNS